MPLSARNEHKGKEKIRKKNQNNRMHKKGDPVPAFKCDEEESTGISTLVADMKKLCFTNADLATRGDIAIYDCYDKYTEETWHLCIAEFRGPWHLKDEGKKRKDYGKVKYLLPEFLRANSILFKLLSVKSRQDLEISRMRGATSRPRNLNLDTFNLGKYTSWQSTCGYLERHSDS